MKRNLLILLLISARFVFAPPSGRQSQDPLDSELNYLDRNTIIREEMPETDRMALEEFRRALPKRESSAGRQHLVGLFSGHGIICQSKMLIEWLHAGEDPSDLTGGLSASAQKKVFMMVPNLMRAAKDGRDSSRLIDAIVASDIPVDEKAEALENVGRKLRGVDEVSDTLAALVEAKLKQRIRTGAMVGLGLSRPTKAAALDVIVNALTSGDEDMSTAATIAGAYLLDDNLQLNAAQKQLQKKVESFLRELSHFTPLQLMRLMENLPEKQVRELIRRSEDKREAERIFLRAQLRMPPRLEEGEDLQKYLFVQELRIKYSATKKETAAIATRILKEIPLAPLLEMTKSEDKAIARAAGRLATGLLGVVEENPGNQNILSEIRQVIGVTAPKKKERTFQSNDVNERRKLAFSFISPKTINRDLKASFMQALETESDPEVLQYFIRAIGMQHFREATTKAFLIRQMKSQAVEVAQLAMEAANSEFKNDGEVITGLVEALGHPESKVKETALKELSDIKPDLIWDGLREEEVLAKHLHEIIDGKFSLAGIRRALDILKGGIGLGIPQDFVDQDSLRKAVLRPEHSAKAKEVLAAMGCDFSDLLKKPKNP